MLGRKIDLLAIRRPSLALLEARLWNILYFFRNSCFCSSLASSGAGSGEVGEKLVVYFVFHFWRRWTLKTSKGRIRIRRVSIPIFEFSLCWDPRQTFSRWFHIASTTLTKQTKRFGKRIFQDTLSLYEVLFLNFLNKFFYSRELHRFLQFQYPRQMKMKYHLRGLGLYNRIQFNCKWWKLNNIGPQQY